MQWTPAGEVSELRHGRIDMDPFGPSLSEGQAHVIGAWLADGTVLRADGRKNYHPRLSITPRIAKVSQVIEWLNDAGVHWYECADNQGTAVLHVNDRDFVGMVLYHFGEGSSGKRFPAWIFSDLKAGQAVLNGYLHGDGWYGRCGGRGKPHWTVNTVSRALAHGTAMLARMLGSHAYLASRRPPHLNSFGKREVFTVRISDNEAAPDDWVTPVKKLTSVGSIPTFDITVAEDHSFLADGVWSHNCHHTGNAAATAQSIRDGRPDLPGPVSQLHIAPDGTVTVVAAGVAWHAGEGSYPGLPTNGANFRTIGIECAWPRDTSITPATQTRERWPDPQIIAMRDTVAAILAKLGYGTERVIGHKEWAGRAQGKWDPGNLDMNWFRNEVGKTLRGQFKVAKPIVVPPTPKPTPQPPIQPKEYPRDFTDRELLDDLWRRIAAFTPPKGK